MTVLVLALSLATSGITVKQGEVFRVQAEAGKVVFDKLSIPVFDGEALVPVRVDLEPGEAPYEVFDTSGRLVRRGVVEVLDGGYPEQDVQVSSTMRALKASPGEREAIEKLQSMETPKRLWREPFRAPVRGCMNSPFGVKRLHNGKPSGRYHLGLDQRGAAGTLVRAPADGVVRSSRMFRLHGGTVGIDHGQGVTTLHIHLSKTIAKEGARVKAGTVIGHVGSTGFATGPHLHWVLQVHGISVNPLPWTPSIKPCGVAGAGTKR